MVEKYDAFSAYRGKPLHVEELRGLVEKEQKEIITRIDYELKIMNDMGYVDYFLIVWDFIKFANDHGIATGAGRGSAAGPVCLMPQHHED